MGHGGGFWAADPGICHDRQTCGGDIFCLSSVNLTLMLVHVQNDQQASQNDKHSHIRSTTGLKSSKPGIFSPASPIVISIYPSPSHSN